MGTNLRFCSEEIPYQRAKNVRGAVQDYSALIDL